MEQLQRQQGAKLEVNLQEKHLLQTQLLLAQQAAAARASRPDLFQRSNGQMYQAAQHSLSRLDLKVEDPHQEAEEMLEPEEGGEEEEGHENGPHLQVKKQELQQVSRFQPYAPAAEPECPALKQEEKERPSPTAHTSFTSPNGFTDWSYEELFKQVRSSLCVNMCWNTHTHTNTCACLFSSLCMVVSLLIIPLAESQADRGRSTACSIT